MGDPSKGGRMASLLVNVVVDDCPDISFFIVLSEKKKWGFERSRRKKERRK